MASRHMRRCSASLVIGEIQVRAMVRCCLILVRAGIIKKSTSNKCWRRCGGRVGGPLALLVTMWIGAATVENNMEVP